ncbi:MAG TPA: efflux RND transporter permease subunit [Thermoanaerobaculia bacterium]|nr:efflux RND transporter permease subunit [Thermoanaerobaculia bacterium]
MAALTEVSIRRPVATAMGFLILIVVGIVALRSLPVDLLPQVEFTQLTVRVRYPNVGPKEIEQIITDPIENAVSGLPNLERVTSESEEGSSRVRLEFTRGTNVDEAANDLRAALDELRNDLPVEADPPQILKLDLDRVEVVSMAATSTRDLESLTRILEDDLAQRFEQIPGVGAIELRGGVYREIRVELDRDRLKAAGLTALDIQQALIAENVTLPGGNVKSGYSDLYVRGLGEYLSVDQIARTVAATVAGKPIRVADVATVHDGYEDVRILSEINGVPSVGLGIQKQSGANTVAVAEEIREEVERINAERDDIHLTIFSDQSEFIRQSIASVRNSALWGGLLAIAVLYFFLRNRSSTVIIALSIPISVISTFGLLLFGGMTLNQMTFGGLALGVGMIVDNAIVVLESIVRKREEEGASAFDAARTGTRDVAGAIVASTLTTCVVFLPVVFTRTTSGALFQAMALVVVFALACSLLVALTLVPMLAARFHRRSGGPRARSGKPGFFGRLEGWYTDRLRQALRRRGLVFAVTGGLLAVALLLWPLIPVELTPPADADEIDVDIEMAQGTNVAVVRSYVDELEARVREALPPGEVELVSTEVRGGDAEVELKLVPQGERSMSSAEVADLLRDAVDGQIPGAEISVDAQPGLWILRRVFSSGGGEDDVEIELRGWDLERADEIAANIRQRIERIPGITDVRVSRREGQSEDNLVFDRDRIAELGLSVREVGRTVQANVGGVEAGRFREEGREVPIVVRLKPGDRLDRQDLRNISLSTPGGAAVPLSSLVESSRARGPVSIERVDGQRVTYVNAGLEEDVTLGDAVERIRAAIGGLALPDGYSVQFGGEYQEQQEAQRDFTIAILMALALVYMLMAAQFERFLDPLIVMLSVPVALLGVVPALLLTGTTLNIQSIMGLVMLIGIVVNNAIVLVDAINLLRREHQMGAVDAVIEAGRLRLRPILMTTTTTVLGLLPLALGIGAGSEIQAPLARVVVGGLTASTFVTLILIPVAYVAATSRVTRFKTHRWRSGEAEEETDRATA